MRGNRIVVRVRLSGTELVKLRQLKKFYGFNGSDQEFIKWLIKHIYNRLYSQIIAEMDGGRE